MKIFEEQKLTVKEEVIRHYFVNHDNAYFFYYDVQNLVEKAIEEYENTTNFDRPKYIKQVEEMLRSSEDEYIKKCIQDMDFIGEKDLSKISHELLFEVWDISF